MQLRESQHATRGWPVSLIADPFNSMSSLMLPTEPTKQAVDGLCRRAPKCMRHVRDEGSQVQILPLLQHKALSRRVKNAFKKLPKKFVQQALMADTWYGFANSNSLPQSDRRGWHFIYARMRI